MEYARALFKYTRVFRLFAFGPLRSLPRGFAAAGVSRKVGYLGERPGKPLTFDANSRATEKSFRRSARQIEGLFNEEMDCSGGKVGACRCCIYRESYDDAL